MKDVNKTTKAKIFIFKVFKLIFTQIIILINKFKKDN